MGARRHMGCRKTLCPRITLSAQPVERHAGRYPVVDDIRDQDVADEDTFARWEQKIRTILPAVEDGDTIVGLSVPGKGASLFLNGTRIAKISDEALSRAFFNIWLGDDADRDLRRKLFRQKMRIRKGSV